MLRAAREKQGLHVAALAATIKIPQRKLEALEADRYDELPDITFTRALAMTVCRALKIDAAPVLARLPQAGARGLGNVTGSLNAPYRERPGRTDPADLGIARHPLYWAALLVLMAAIALFFLPTGWWASLMPGASGADALPQAGAASAALPFTLAASAAPAADAVASVAAAPAASQAMVEVVHAAPAPDSGASEAADGAGGVALLRASEASWVEVVDAGGQVLVQRVLQPGESLGLDGKLPFKLKIGNAAATSLVFRGQPVDLAALTRDNVARLELK
jgi:cytoskeleton protein RodZ